MTPSGDPADDSSDSRESTPGHVGDEEFCRGPQSTRRGHFFRRCGFVLLNFWIVFHLIAVMVAPATVGPSSRTARGIWLIVRPYLQSLNLNHGFHYFSPQPGSSHIVSWAVTRDDGETITGQFPNRDIQPRLMYHRHFMLSEFLGNTSPELQAILAEQYADHLCQEYEGTTAALSLLRHNLPTMERIRAGGRLDDADLYEEQPLGVFERSGEL